uniref:Uncharacterized protein n=1 Tax=Solanum lycopersicum TaxID=4081 RepID=A0A3Q7HZV1_SOLLC
MVDPSRIPSLVISILCCNRYRGNRSITRHTNHINPATLHSHFITQYWFEQNHTDNMILIVLRVIIHLVSHEKEKNIRKEDVRVFIIFEKIIKVFFTVKLHIQGQNNVSAHRPEDLREQLSKARALAHQYRLPAPLLHWYLIFVNFTIIRKFIKSSNIKLVTENSSNATKTTAKLRSFLRGSNISDWLSSVLKSADPANIKPETLGWLINTKLVKDLPGIATQCPKKCPIPIHHNKPELRSVNGPEGLKINCNLLLFPIFSYDCSGIKHKPVWWNLIVEFKSLLSRCDCTQHRLTIHSTFDV